MPDPTHERIAEYIPLKGHRLLHSFLKNSELGQAQVGMGA
jgi:hypothetical protein